MDIGQSEIILDGGSPVYERTPGQMGVDPMMQAEYAADQAAENYFNIRTAGDNAGWGEVYEGFKGILDEYRAVNESNQSHLTAQSSEIELFQASLLAKPTEVDPQKLADLRSRLLQVDAAIKEVDPRASVFAVNPESGMYQVQDYKEIAGWINREAGIGTLGFMSTGPEEMEGVVGSQMLISGAEGGTDLALNLLYGAYDLGAKALRNLGVVDLPGPPTNYVKDPMTGELIPNTARPAPGLTELLVMARNVGDTEAIFDELTALQNARDMESLQRSGAGEVMVGAAQLVGMMGLPMVGPGGFTPAMRLMGAGNLLGRSLVTKGLAKLGTTSARSEKILTHIGGLTGAATANGMAMAVAYGRVQDYGTQFQHGAVIAPILLTMGAMGKGVERILRTRRNMPASLRDKIQDGMAAAMGGGVEGYAFGVMDDVQTRGLWEFLKDPTPENWGRYLGNMAGMALLKVAGGREQGANQRRAADEKKVRDESAVAVEAVGEGRLEASEVRPEAAQAAKGDRGAVEKIIAEHAGPTGRQGREIEGALSPEQRFKPESQKTTKETADTVTEFIEKALGPKGYASSKEYYAAQEAAAERPEGVRKAERPGVGSFQAGPERQQRPVTGETIELGQMREIMEGKRGRAGIRVLGKRIFSRQGDPVQVDFKEGKTQGMEGISKKLGVVRSRVGNDIPVMAHEWSHESMAVLGRRRQAAGFGRQEAFEQEAQEFIDSTKGGVTEAHKMLVGDDPSNPLYPGAGEWFEAIQPGYKGKMDPEFALYKIGSEAWAEIGARKLLGDAVRMEQEAPGLSKSHEATLVGEARMFEQFTRIGEAMQIWRDQGSSKRQELSASATEKKVRKRRVKKQGGRVAVAARSTKRSLVDDLAEGRAELERAEIAVGQEPGSTSLSVDPFAQRDRIVGTAAATAEAFVMHGTINPEGLPTGESLRAVFRRVHKQGITPAEFKNFLNSVRGLEDYKKGLDTTLAKEDYIGTLKDLYDKIPALKAVAKDLKGYTGRVIDFVEQSGGMTRADAAKFKDGRHVYVTLLRVIEESGAGRRGQRGVGPKAAKGSGKELFDLSEAMVAMTNHYVRQGLRAQVDQAFLGAAHRGLGHFAEIVPKSAQPQKVEVQDFLNKLREKAETLEELEAIEILDGMSASAVTTFTGRRFPGPADKLIIPVVDRDSGKVEWIQVAKEGYDLSTGADIAAIPQNVLAKVGRALSGVFKKGAIEWNPHYAVGAAARDMMFRGSVTRGGFAKKLRYGLGSVGHLMDLAIGGRKILQNTEFVQRLRATGTMSSGIVGFTKQARNLNAELAGASSKIRKLLRGTDITLSALTNWTENAPRIQAAQDVYKRNLKAGMSDKDAFQDAQMAYREEQINFAKGGSMLRAISGYVPFAKAAFLGQQKAASVFKTKAGVAAAFANITVPSMISYLFYKDEDWFKNLEVWERLGYIHVTKDIRVPIPYELGQIFATGPQFIADHITREPLYRAGSDEWVALAQEVLIPWMGDMRSAPPFIKTVIELKTGYDFFRDKPIVPEWIKESRIPEEQVKLGTSQFAIDTFATMPNFFQTLGIDNPAELAHLVKGTIPGIAPHLVKAAESGEAIQFLPTERFVVRGGHQAKTTRLLNERVTELTQIGKKNLDREGRMELVRLRRAKAKISALYKDESLTQEERSDKIREVSMKAMEAEQR